MVICTLTCPKCKGKTKKDMPKGNICVPSFVCSKCKETIWAKNKCCVFCDYSDKKCKVEH